MTSRSLSLRLRRRLRRSRRHVEDLGLLAGEQLDAHLIHRFSRFFMVWRFVTAWILVFIFASISVVSQATALVSYYSSPSFIPGGIYDEGIIGDFTNANPIYATSPVDRAVSRLVFSGLLTYNNHNQLIGDLAESYGVDSTGKVYTVVLKPNIYWQDGQPLTAQDVAFTYHLIQNPDTQSPLQNSWQGVSVQVVAPNTVTFTLPNALSAFPYSLTTGIVPEHILSGIPVAELRSAKFNSIAPIGTGPFRWKSLEVNGTTPQTRQERVILTPNSLYYGQKPKLADFIIDAYHDQNLMIQNFQNGTLTAMSGLNTVPTVVAHDSSIKTYNLPVTGAEMVFFKTTDGFLGDTTVRQALVKAENVNHIIRGLGYAAIPIKEPLLINQLGYNAQYAQQQNDPTAAAQLLTQDGWIVGKGGIRYKGGQPMTFGLYAADTPEDRYVVGSLISQWKAIGVNVQPFYEDSTTFQNTVAFHSYDALLDGISIGVDPDVFVYWDSSQASPQSGNWLNFSEYKSTAADQGLEAGRTVTDPALRIVKYQGFLQAWQNDDPALGLYQPRLLYITHGIVNGLTNQQINEPADRYDNVVNWEIATGTVRE